MMDYKKPILTALLALFVVVVFSIVARFTYLGGSLFDPAVAPGIGPLALGDLLAGLALIVGYWIGYIRTPKKPA